MKPLEFPFTRAEYRHVLLARVGLWCVVERTWIGDGKPHLPHFEIVKLRDVHEKPLPGGRSIRRHEAYPSPRDWGKVAWAEPSLLHAKQRWQRLAAAQQLPAWESLGIADDPEGYQAWREGRLPRRATG